MYKAVLFDMDGTLVDSVGDLGAATNHALSLHGYETRPVERYGEFAGSGVYVMIQRALKPVEVDDDTLHAIRDDFFKYYEKHCTVHTTVYNGVKELVAKLKKSGIKVGCITNKVEPIAKEIINHFFDGMDVVYGQVDGVPNKPDPLLTLRALKDMDVGGDECLFVGDTDVDMNTASAAGCASVGVLWGYRSREVLENAGAKFIVSSADEVLEIVESK